MKSFQHTILIALIHKTFNMLRFWQPLVMTTRTLLLVFLDLRIENEGDCLKVYDVNPSRVLKQTITFGRLHGTLMSLMSSSDLT